jgi:acetyl esterase/lipase
MRDQGIPLPAGAILISPWVDLTHSFPSIVEDNPGDTTDGSLLSIAVRLGNSFFNILGSHYWLARHSFHFLYPQAPS